MTLSKKVLIIVGFAFLCTIGVLFAITSNIVLGSFAKLEEQNVRVNIKRVLNAFQDELAGLDSTAGDWAPWNETRDFVLSANKNYIDSNLADVTLTNLQLNFMIFINSTGQLIHAKEVDLIEEQDKSVSKTLIKHLLGHKYLLQHADPKDSKAGIILLPESPTLIATWPITNNELKGPIHGTLIIGRYLVDKEIRNLMEKTELSINFVRTDSSALPADFETAHSLFSEEAPVVIQVLNTETVAGYTELDDIYGNPCLLLKVEMPRDILKHGRYSTNYFMWVLLSVGVIVLLVLLATLQTTILGPIAKLSRHILAVGETGDLSVRLPMKRKDEIGILANEFDNMLTQLQKRSTELETVNEKLQEDIDNRIQVERALRESEERFGGFARASGYGFAMGELTGQLVFGNPATLRIVEEEQETDFTAKTFYQYYSEEDKKLLKADILPIVMAKGQWKGELPLLTAKGNLTPTEQNIFLISDEDGAPQMVGNIITDITERKLAEEALRESEEKLRQSLKMESIGTLAGGIAHDFNNVLYSIVGYTELTMDDVPEGSLAQSNLKEVFKGAMRAKDMVQQILAFSRKADTEKKPIKVQSAVKEALKLLRTSIPATIEIRQNIDADCSPVLADSTQIHQVIMNLATNAYQAMREKGGVLELTLMGEEISSDDSDLDLNPGTYLKLTVSDTGHGMDNVVIEKIFDPYFSTKSPGEGTGMGLAVVHGIVKDHGGNIEVYSKLGEGTTFSVYLPLVETRPLEPETVSVVPVLTGTERILFVDDEETLVFMTQQTLERLGYQVTSRTSSVEALEAFRAKPDAFDLVITDMTMPNMTGVELTSRLKEIRADIPIIICTGFSEVIDKNRAKALGIREYVMKPIVKEEIARTIRKVLDEGREK